MEFNHIGIFVNSISIGIKELRKVVNIKKKTKIIEDKNLGVKVIFLYDNKKICYELIEPFGKNNPVSNTLKKKVNILNHIAYQTKNFDKDLKKLIKTGFRPFTNIVHAKAFSNKRVIFLINKMNFINELIEK